MSDDIGRTVRTRQTIYTDAGEIPMGTILTNARPTDSKDTIEVVWNGMTVWIPRSQLELTY